METRCSSAGGSVKRRMPDDTEYRTQPLARPLLLDELDFFCAFLSVSLPT